MPSYAGRSHAAVHKSATHTNYRVCRLLGLCLAWNHATHTFPPPSTGTHSRTHTGTHTCPPPSTGTHTNSTTTTSSSSSTTGTGTHMSTGIDFILGASATTTTTTHYTKPCYIKTTPALHHITTGVSRGSADEVLRLRRGGRQERHLALRHNWDATGGHFSCEGGT